VNKKTVREELPKSRGDREAHPAPLELCCLFDRVRSFSRGGFFRSPS
jgi:hypothetical protein